MAVDSAGVLVLVRTLKNTSVRIGHLEGELSKVARLQMVEDPIVSVGSPFLDILLGYQDGAVSGLAAGATVEAMQDDLEYRIQGEIDAGRGYR